MPSNLNIMSFNCRGIHTKKKRISDFHHLKNLKHNIYCLQDTHFTNDMYSTIYSEWGNEIFLSCNTSQSRGVAILFGNLDYEIHQSLLDSDGNYVLLDLTIDDHRFTLASFYGPNQDNPQF